MAKIMIMAGVLASTGDIFTPAQSTLPMPAIMDTKHVIMQTILPITSRNTNIKKPNTNTVANGNMLLPSSCTISGRDTSMGTAPTTRNVTEGYCCWICATYSRTYCTTSIDAWPLSCSGIFSTIETRARSPSRLMRKSLTPFLLMAYCFRFCSSWSESDSRSSTKYSTYSSSPWIWL